ncbi:MAG: DUF3108 domain-containing protein [Saprospiraceae bacterium]|nr:DUF3108 domain-containing protein [Saprospiraceae bacterium]
MTIKPIALFLGLSLTAFTPQSPTVQGSGPEPCANTNTTFQNGEKITYKIYYNLNFVWVPAGEVVFKIFDEGNQWHYQAIGSTYPSYEWFFSVRDEYNSWVDKNTLLPNYSERSVNEGNYHIFEKISFNQRDRKMTVWRSKKKGESETKTEHTVQDCVHDVLSSLYNLRNVDFASQQPGYALPFRIFMDKEEFPLKMKYMGKEAKKKVYGMGKYDTMKFQPDVIAGEVFKDGTKMTVWVSDDKNRIPLLIETPVSVGSVKMVIKEYWGLKYDFTAKR